VTLADEVDHIVPMANGGTDDDQNLEAICTGCHKVKTQKESGSYRERQAIGPDGWPVAVTAKAEG
jgi:5-methylcytosine-specific restriction protein A